MCLSVTDSRHRHQEPAPQSANVLRPYGIRLIYSDSDMPNGPVFETILERIRATDFSIFDDRETEVRRTCSSNWERPSA